MRALVYNTEKGNNGKQCRSFLCKGGAYPGQAGPMFDCLFVDLCLSITLIALHFIGLSRVNAVRRYFVTRPVVIIGKLHSLNVAFPRHLYYLELSAYVWIEIHKKEQITVVISLIHVSCTHAADSRYLKY